MLAMAAKFSKRVEESSPDVDQQVQLAFDIALGRRPDAALARSLSEYSNEFGLANTCRLLFNLNEFVFVD